jgi:hypothetical protein
MTSSTRPVRDRSGINSEDVRRFRAVISSDALDTGAAHPAQSTVLQRLNGFGRRDGDLGGKR